MRRVLSILHLLLAVSALAQDTLPSSFAPMGRIGMGGSVGTPIPAVAWYKLDGNALDSSGNGYHGTWRGTEAYAAGKFAGTQAAVFDGASRIFNGSIGTGPGFTVVAWQRQSTNNATRQYLVASAGLKNLLYTDVKSLGVDSSFTVAARDTTTRSVSGGALLAGTWTHVAGTCGPEGLAASVNGTRIGLNTAVTNAASDIGYYLGTYGSFFLRGALQDVRIFDRALSLANIQRIMESQDNEPLEELQ